MAGHAGDGVVQHDDHGVGTVIGDVDEAGDAGVGKGGVTDDRHALFLPFRSPGFVVAVEGGHGGAHTDTGIHGAQGSAGPQGIAADVSADVDLLPL